MKKSTKKNIYAVIGILILISKVYSVFTEPNFGFADFWYGEGLGYNVAHIGFTILGIWLTYKGLKKEN